MSTDPVEAAKNNTQLVPRGTDRVRRRTQQAEAKVKEREEVANLTSPSGPEKDAAIAANKAKRKETFGTTNRDRRIVEQTLHKRQAEAEAARVSSAVPTILATLQPGQQVDHVTARRFMKERNTESRDENRQAAQAAAVAVRDVLNGRPTSATRTRKAAKHAAAQAAANAKKTT